MEQKKLSVQANMVWNSFGSFVYLLLQWLQTIVVVRISGYEANGNFALAMSLTNVFGVIAGYSMRNYQVSDTNGKYSHGDYIGSRYVTCCLGMAACAVFVAVNGYDFMQSAIIICYMLFRLSENFVDVFHGIDQRYWRMDIVGKSLLIRGIADFLVFAAVLYVTDNLLVSIISMAVVSLVFIVCYDIPKSKGIVSVQKPDWTGIRHLLQECFPLVVYLVISNGIVSVPRYFLERYQGSEVLGIYGSIATPTVIVQVAASYLFSPLITVFSELYNGRKMMEFKRLVVKIFAVILGLSVIALGGCWLLGDWGLQVLLGEGIKPYTYLLIPIMTATILNAVVWFLCALLTVVRDFKGLIISNVLAFAACGAASLLLIPERGMNGVNETLYVSLVIEIILLAVFGLGKIGAMNKEKK